MPIFITNHFISSSASMMLYPSLYRTTEEWNGNEKVPFLKWRRYWRENEINEEKERETLLFNFLLKSFFCIAIVDDGLYRLIFELLLELATIIYIPFHSLFVWSCHIKWSFCFLLLSYPIHLIHSATFRDWMNVFSFS